MSSFDTAPPIPPPKPSSQSASRTATPPTLPAPPTPPAQDPGDQWLPKMLEDKSSQDLAHILSTPPLLAALTHHPSTPSATAPLLASLSENIDLATRLSDLETRLSALREGTQARLLAVHALERTWRQKQADMDVALARFAPAALYQLLARGVAEQASVCAAMEESFLEAQGDDGVEEWARRYRDARGVYYLRKERKERWDEGRVGGWP